MKFLPKPTTRRRIRGYIIMAAVLATLGGVAALTATTYYSEDAAAPYAYDAQNPSPLFGGGPDREFKSPADRSAFTPPPPPGAGAPP